MAMSEESTLKAVLNDPEGRYLVDQIEDVLGSLRGKDGDPGLERILANLVDELEQKLGYRYSTADEKQAGVI
jgi:hypothetical protein